LELQKQETAALQEPKFDVVKVMAAWVSLYLVYNLISFFYCYFLFNFWTYLVISALFGVYKWKPQYFSVAIAAAKGLPPDVYKYLVYVEEQTQLTCLKIKEVLIKYNKVAVVSFLEKIIQINSTVVDFIKSITGSPKGNWTIFFLAAPFILSFALKVVFYLF